MKFLRYLLFPFAFVYSGVVRLRNYLYDIDLLKSTSYNFPLIVIGNLSVGGTGKTPMTAYMLNLLQKKYQVGMLSRGYKRQSEGFYIADATTTVAEIGDEPFQLHCNFPNAVVAVDADRRNGIAQLKKLNKLPDVLLLDDAYQHRKVKAGMYVLLTTYDALYVNDCILPTGNLRDTKNQAKRAACIVVTKCSESLSESDKQAVVAKLNPLPHQKVYFTSIAYSDVLLGKDGEKPLMSLQETKFTLVTGIAKPEYLVSYLESKGLQFEHLKYSDHHNFSETEIQTLRQKELIVTTEKDYVRLQNKLDTILYLPITTQFLADEDMFELQLMNFVAAEYKS